MNNIPKMPNMIGIVDDEKTPWTLSERRSESTANAEATVRLMRRTVVG